MGRRRVKKTKKEKNLSRRIEKNVQDTNLPYKSQISQPKHIREVGLDGQVQLYFYCFAEPFVKSTEPTKWKSHQTRNKTRDKISKTEAIVTNVQVALML